PAVVNLSLGGHFDAHDGSDPLSAIIDQESGPGRIVCCAAGNEGNDNIHAQVHLPPGDAKTIRFRVPAQLHQFVELNGWYPGANALQVSITSPSGAVTPFQDIIAAGNFERQYSLPDAQVSVATPPVNPVNGDVNFIAALLGAQEGSAVAGGIW